LGGRGVINGGVINGGSNEAVSKGAGQEGVWLREVKRRQAAGHGHLLKVRKECAGIPVNKHQMACRGGALAEAVEAYLTRSACAGSCPSCQ
jgi:hypothetical protein